jgi:hypothetical protein
MADPLPADESPTAILEIVKHPPDKWLGFGIFLLAVAALLSTVGLLITGHQANDRAVSARRVNIEVIQKLADQSDVLACRAAAAVTVNQAQAELTVAIADVIVAVRENRPSVPGLLETIHKASEALSLAIVAQRAALTTC